MNFISAFSELEKLYEEQTEKNTAATKQEVADDKDTDTVTSGATQEPTSGEQSKGMGANKLTEAADDEEIEIVDDEPVEDAPIDEVPADEEVDVEVVDDENRQVVIECSKCGALVIVNEADLVVDEASDLVNVDVECQFCEETAGYKIVGSVFPYEPIDSDDVEDDVPAEELPEEDEELDEFLDIKPSVSLNLDGGQGNDVSVLGK